MFNGIAITRYSDEYRFRPKEQYLLRGVYPVHLRHVLIQDNKVILVDFTFVDRFRPIQHSLTANPLFAQLPFKQHARGEFVIGI